MPMMSEADEVQQLLSGADQVADMANKVAGFATAQSLVITFAAINDSHKVFTEKWGWFVMGGAVGTAVYVVAVILFHHRAEKIRALVAGNFANQLKAVSETLLAARIVAIVSSGLIMILAAFGVAHPGH